MTNKAIDHNVVLDKFLYYVGFGLCLYIGVSIVEFFDIAVIGDGSKPPNRSVSPLAQLGVVVFLGILKVLQVALIGAFAVLIAGIPIYAIFIKKILKSGANFILCYMASVVLCGGVAFTAGKVIEQREQDLLNAASIYYTGESSSKTISSLKIGVPVACVIEVERQLKANGERRQNHINIELQERVLNSSMKVTREDMRNECQSAYDAFVSTETSRVLYPSKTGLALVDYDGEVYFCLGSKKNGECEYRQKVIRQQLLANKCLSFVELHGRDQSEWVRCPSEFVFPAEGMDSGRFTKYADETTNYTMVAMQRKYPYNSN
jgi:hypothetical protein